MLLAATDISHANNQSAYWAATAKQNQQYMLYLFDDNNQVIRKIQLPGRAHGLSQSTNGQLVVSSRRPGTWLLLLAHATDQATWLQLPQHRRLAGHTCFSRDNKTFYSAENDFEGKQGVIGVWDTDTGLRLTEWASHGIGPHQIKLSANGKNLWVANGGILTHPDQGREKLNLETMAPNVSNLRLTDGMLLDQYQLQESQLSLRHIDVNRHNQVAVAGQYQGPEYQRKQLMAYIKDGSITVLPCNTEVKNDLCNYLGSVVFDHSGEWLAASSPRGNRVIIWHLALHHTHYHTLTISDVCGLRATAQAGQFIISTGLGSLYQYCAITNDLVGLAENTHLAWDNHLSNRPQSALIPVKIAT